MMKKILYSVLTLVLGLVLSSSGCSTTIDPFDPVIYDEGVTINGFTWATRNVDAPGKFAVNAGSAGMFYQWNNKKAWPATGGGTWPTTSAGGTSWATANDPCPDGWRVPIKAEFESLVAATVTKTWGTSSGKNGLWFGTASEPHQLFFPAVGFRHAVDGSHGDNNVKGYYWVSVQSNNISGNHLSVHSSTGGSFGGSDKTCGFSVRCVKK